MTNRTCGVAGTALAVIFAGIFSMAAIAQQKTAPRRTNRIVTDLLPLTCAQAWVKSNKSYPQMLSIVKTLARVSLANRDLTFPDTREAGLDAGKGIAEDCKADPHALLFAIVDKHVRRVAEAAASSGGQ
jgi:hypothetical protein